MKVEYINPFIEASQSVLKQIAGVDAVLGKVYLREPTFRGENVMVLVGITGSMRGQVIFDMNKVTATGIASSMMGGMPVPELDDISRSAISELTNMILGNTATLLYNKGIEVEITPPSFLTGNNLEVSSNKMKTICVPLLLQDERKMEINISVEGE